MALLYLVSWKIRLVLKRRFLYFSLTIGFDLLLLSNSTLKAVDTGYL